MAVFLTCLFSGERACKVYAEDTAKESVQQDVAQEEATQEKGKEEPEGKAEGIGSGSEEDVGLTVDGEREAATVDGGEEDRAEKEQAAGEEETEPKQTKGESEAEPGAKEEPNQEGQQEEPSLESEEEGGQSQAEETSGADQEPSADNGSDRPGQISGSGQEPGDEKGQTQQVDRPGSAEANKVQGEGADDSGQIEEMELLALDEEAEPLTPSMRESTVLSARNTSIGISASSPRKGQENRYEYVGSEVSWSVPMDGVYDIYCYGGGGGTGAQGGDYKSHHGYDTGRGGEMRGSRLHITGGSVLTVHVGSRGGDAPNGEVRGMAGWSDGREGGKAEYRCDDDHDHNGYATSGGSGGSSYVLYNGTKIISAKGGASGGAWSNSCGGELDVGGKEGGGVTVLNSSGTAVWDTAAVNSSAAGSNAGNGYILVRVVEVFPRVALTGAPVDWTNGDVTLTASVISYGTGRPSGYLSWEEDADGNPVWTDEATHTVSENGIYTCKIRDTNGNMAKATYTVNKIDKLSPEGEVSATPDDWTAEDIVLTVSARDAEGTSQSGKSGLHEKPYFWESMGKTEEDEKGQGTGSSQQGEDETSADGQQGERQDMDGDEEQTQENGQQEGVWTEQPGFTACENGVYLCKIRDKAGNITEMKYTVASIDRTPPELSCKKEGQWYEGGMYITLEARDLQPDGTEGCGLDDTPYSTDGLHFQSSPRLYITEEGICSVWVRDLLGNVRKVEFTFTHDKKELEEAAEPNENTDPDQNKESDENKGSDGGGSRQGTVAGFMELEPLPMEIEPFLLEAEPDGTGSSSHGEAAKTGEQAERAPQRGLGMIGEEAAFAMPVEEIREQRQEPKKLPVLREEGEKQHPPRVSELKSPAPGKINWKRAALYSAWVAVVLCGLVYLLVCLLLEHVTVYKKDERGKYRKIGRCAILRKKEYKQINLFHLMKKGEEADYKVCFSRAFTLLYKNDKVLLRTYHGVELRNVAKEIEILSCNS